MSILDMNRPLELADELINHLADETDNMAEFLAGLAIAVRRIQGYQDYAFLALNPMLKELKMAEE